MNCYKIASFLPHPDNGLWRVRSCKRVVEHLFDCVAALWRKMKTSVCLCLSDNENILCDSVISLHKHEG